MSFERVLVVGAGPLVRDATDERDVGCRQSLLEGDVRAIERERTGSRSKCCDREECEGEPHTSMRTASP